VAGSANPWGPWSLSALLVLADGRFPAGGHAHSGGLEAVVACEGVSDIPNLELFLRGRLGTTGSIAAAFAAATCAAWSRSESDAAHACQLDSELDARLPSPSLRTISRRLGRQMLRAGRGIWPHPYLERLSDALPRGAHQPVALGTVAAAAGLPPVAAAATAAYDTVAGPAKAAVRLLGLDPFSVHATLARLGAEIDAIAVDGASYADAAAADLPAWSTPLLDLLAEHHATWEVRLFAS
jgi:urease accessory protein